MSDSTKGWILSKRIGWRSIPRLVESRQCLPHQKRVQGRRNRMRNHGGSKFGVVHGVRCCNLGVTILAEERDAASRRRGISKERKFECEP